MNHLFRIAASCGAISLAVVSAQASANSYGGSLSGTTQLSDNAGRGTDEKYSERQDRLTLGLFGDYENATIDASARYAATAHRYAKDSQPSRNVLEGESSLRIGKVRNFANLLLIHSRRSLLNEPDAVDLISNRDERDVFSVIPTLRFGITSVDSIMVRGNYSKASYRFNELRDSESVGASLIWEHNFSAVDALQVSVQQNEVTFDAVPAADYDYRSALISYSTTLRNLNYRIAGGYNSSERHEGAEYSGPTFIGELGYSAGPNRFSLQASQVITDTSMGDRNRPDMESGFETRDVSGTGIDQIERRSVDLRWDSNIFCERCDVYANAYVRNDSYFNLNEDNEERGIGAGIGYRLSRAASLQLSGTRREQRFDENIGRDQYTLNQVRVAYNYTFVNDLSTTVFIEHRDRASGSGQTNYNESVGGLSLNYSF